MLVTNPKAVLLISDIRLRELEETGANTVITSCPTCEKTIKTTIKLRKAKMTCIDIVELVKKAMGG
jgi:Fe-S oxidoreductase